MTNHVLIGGKHAPQGLISRVADCCFWFGRYVERAEATARHLQATLHLGLDGELGPRQSWHPAVIVAGEEADFLARLGDAALSDGEAVQRYLVWDAECGASLVRSVIGARENARSIREVLSGDVWEVVNEIYLFLQGPEARDAYAQRRDEFYRHVRRMTQLALGLMRSTMLHDAVLDFIWLGVMLERANQTARLLDVHHHAFARGERAGADVVVSTAVWIALLRACSGHEPFMKSHAGRVSPEAVATFLVTDARLPRSIAYAVHAAWERFCYLRPPTDVNLPGAQSLVALASLDRWVQSLDPAELEGDGLHKVLTRIVDDTAKVAVTLGRELLGHS
ncbi:MAG: alpha-E domain-containing protein [Deltaproteobacteria bacterium]|nr:alpha-E domain-containing protein [Deltaproteobacteria bacterium]